MQVFVKAIVLATFSVIPLPFVKQQRGITILSEQILQARMTVTENTRYIALSQMMSDSSKWFSGTYHYSTCHTTHPCQIGPVKRPLSWMWSMRASLLHKIPSSDCSLTQLDCRTWSCSRDRTSSSMLRASVAAMAHTHTFARASHLRKRNWRTRWAAVGVHRRSAAHELDDHILVQEHPRRDFWRRTLSKNCSWVISLNTEASFGIASRMSHTLVGYHLDVGMLCSPGPRNSFPALGNSRTVWLTYWRLVAQRSSSWTDCALRDSPWYCMSLAQQEIGSLCRRLGIRDFLNPFRQRRPDRETKPCHSQLRRVQGQEMGWGRAGLGRRCQRSRRSRIWGAV